MDNSKSWQVGKRNYSLMRADAVDSPAVQEEYGIGEYVPIREGRNEIALVPADRPDLAYLIAEASAMADALRRFLDIRQPNSGKWTRAETERSYAELETRVNAILTRATGDV